MAVFYAVEFPLDDAKSRGPHIVPESKVKEENGSTRVLNAFQLDIAVSDLCLDPPDNPEDLAMCYNTLKKILDDHAPVVTRTTINRPPVPWIREEMRASKRERRRAEKKWRRSKS